MVCRSLPRLAFPAERFTAHLIGNWACRERSRTGQRPPDPRLRCVGNIGTPIWAQEQVAQGAAEQIRKPSLREMMRPVVHDVAALAEAAQIVQLIVAGVMVEMRGRQHDPRRPHAGCFL
jgi:hypothetical protein